MPLRAGRLAAAIAALTVTAGLASPQVGVHPLTGRRIAATMSVDGADWLDRPERDLEEDPDRALDVLKIAKGSTVADIGAGSGYMTVKLGKKVGPMGRVYANDIQTGMLDLLNRRVLKAHLSNVLMVLGTPDDPKLPADTLDLALMVDVYHEMSQPQAMLRRIHESLKAGGRLALVEYRKEDPDIPIKPEHKMSVAEARTEVEAEGFHLARTNEDLPRQHVLMFARP